MNTAASAVGAVERRMDHLVAKACCCFEGSVEKIREGDDHLGVGDKVFGPTGLNSLVVDLFGPLP